MRVPLICILFLAIFHTNTVAQLAPELTVRATRSLKNQDVLDMAKAKFADSTILKAIQANDTDFDVSVPALVKLKNAGVNQHVIEAMLSATSSRKGIVVPATDRARLELSSETSAALTDEIGVYVKQQGKMTTIEPEIVNWRTGGVLKTLATVGLDKGHVNGSVVGPHSHLTISWPRLGMAGPLEFLVRCTDGTSVSEYQLLRLWDKGNRREFRAVTGGVLHASGGARENAVAFKFEKIAPRTYKIQFSQMEPGEYGFLAPGAAASASIASNGKIYTFRIPD